MIIHEHNLQIIDFKANNFLFIVRWTALTKKMTADNFKEQFMAYLKYLLKYTPKFVLFDMKEFDFPITPELQNWIDKEITSHEKKICQKQAILMPTELIAELGIAQTLDEDNNKSMNIQIFDN